MRALLRTSVLPLLIAAGLATEARAQLFNIFPRTNTWRYNTNCQFATGWETVGFDDSSWSFGPGGFTGGETTAAIVAQCATTNLPPPGGSAGGRPNYFRTHFNVASTNGLSLILSNAIDDGALFFLNGAPVLSLRGPPTNNCPAFSTGGAIGANTDALLWEVSTLTPAILGGIIHPGDNVLAVSVHQVNAGSSDMVFSEVLMGQFDVPPSINYPASSLSNRIVTECRSTTLAVSGNGIPVPTYQWFHNGSPIFDATNASYTITNARSSDGGNYYVTLSNASGTTNSTPDTVVNIAFDNAPPYVVAAYTAIQDDPNVMAVVFNEPVDSGSVTSPGNYSLMDTNFGFGLAVVGATLTNNNTVILNVSPPFDPTHGYLLTVVNIADACNFNYMTSPNYMPVSTYMAPAIGLNAATFWRYEQSGTDLGTAWSAVGYNDSGWFSGAGTFDAKRTNATSPLPLCRPFIPTNNEPVRTCLTLSNAASTAQIPTIYFRKQFNFNGDTNGAVLRVVSLLDDGAVFYFNGVELARIGMAGTPVSYNTSANRTIGDASYETNYFVPSNLGHGLNTVAVELHQANLTSSDSTFGMQLDVLSPTPAQSQPPVFTGQPQSQTVTAGSTVAFSVGVAGAGPFTYQWHVNCRVIRHATNATLTISNVGPVDVGNYSVTVTGPAFGQATSDDATLELGSMAAPTIRVSSTPTNLVLQWPRRDVSFRVQEVSNIVQLPLPWTNADAEIVTGESNVLGTLAHDTARKFLRLASPSLHITVQPQGRSANLGDDVISSVTATGAPPISYQWMQNGYVIIGATNPTLVVTMSDLSKFGAYQVTAQNNIDAVTSREAVVRLAGTETALSDSFNTRPLFTNSSASIHGLTLGATSEAGEPNHAGLPGGKSLWFSWQSPFSGVVTFDTVGSAFDTLLGAYTGNNVFSLIRVAGDDDTASNLCSRIRFNVSPGVIYNIALDGLGGASGFFVVNWNFMPTASTLPIIDVQPVDRIISTNQPSTTFSVVAHDPTPGSNVTYQWYYNGNPVPASSGGNNPTLNVGGPTPSVALQHGQYFVDVINSAFVVRSRFASLQFSSNPQLRFVSKPIADTLCEFEPSTSTNCCGASFSDPGKGQDLLSASTGSLYGSVVLNGPTPPSGVPTRRYWTWVTNSWSCKKTITLTAGIAPVNNVTLVVVDSATRGRVGSPTPANGTSARMATFAATASRAYWIAIGCDDASATVTLNYTSPLPDCP
jgi:hypothetical protein